MTEAQAAARAEVALDHHSPEYRDDPYAQFKAMRDSGCPVAHSEAYDGFWALADYASVYEAARDDDLFNSHPSVGIPAMDVPFPVIPIEYDPPQNKELRDATLRQFSPAAAERLRPIAIQIATELIDEFIERGECDIVEELTTPLPARLILRLLEWDESRYLEWVHWVHSIVHDRTHDPDGAALATMELFGEINRQLVQRRAEGLGDDLFSDILRGTLDGQPFDDIQITMYGFMMMLGGMDSTSGLMGNVLLELCNDTALRAELTSDPELVARGTDEFLRFCTPSLGLARTVSKDAVFHGQELHQGDRALMFWGAANRDPKVFDDPETLDIHRANARKHMSFGVGIHRCLGSHFATMMFRVMLSQILERLPDFELAGEYKRFADAGEVHAVCTLPIRFTPGQRVGAA